MSDRESDESLLKRYRNFGDSGAYRQIYYRYVVRLFYRARMFGLEEFMAAKVAEEALLALVNTKEEIIDLEHWFLVMIHQKSEEIMARGRFDLSGFSATHSDPGSPMHFVPRDREVALLKACIDKLVHRDRSVVVFRSLLKLSTETIARMFGVSNDSVCLWVVKARARIKKCLKQQGLGDPN